jgi:hypothetical protein
MVDSWMILKEAGRKQRDHAGFFHWPDKLVKEGGIANEFAAALAREGGHQIASGKQIPPGQDPPDFEMTTETGEHWGVEITELVSQKAIEATARNKLVHAIWSNDGLIAALRAIVTDKDHAKGGPYDRYVLVVHTDEDDLRADRLQNVLGNQIFETRLITDIYLLTSYDTHVGYAPLLHFATVTGALAR